MTLSHWPDFPTGKKTSEILEDNYPITLFLAIRLLKQTSLDQVVSFEPSSTKSVDWSGLWFSGRKSTQNFKKPNISRKCEAFPSRGIPTKVTRFEDLSDIINCTKFYLGRIGFKFYGVSKFAHSPWESDVVLNTALHSSCVHMITTGLLIENETG
jgi:hypothetical protein